MAILITGGAGFIGSNFILDWFELHDEPLINVDKLTYAGNLTNFSQLKASKNLIFIEADINDKLVLARLLEEYSVRAVIHFAAESHVDRSISSPDAFIQTNIVGTFNLLDVVKTHWTHLPQVEQKLFRFVHISTDEVFGSLSPIAPAFTEQSRYEPNSPYSASKASADHLVRAYYHTYGLPTITVNCSNNYGPYQFPEKLIPLTICRALAGEAIGIYGHGNQIRDWLFVKDHCAAIRTILLHGQLGEVYPVGGLNEQTNLEVVSAICALLDEKQPKLSGSYFDQVQFIKDRPGHDQRYAINPNKIFQELGWKPLETFSTGLKKTVDWYLANQSWTNKIKSRVYTETNTLTHEQPIS